MSSGTRRKRRWPVASIPISEGLRNWIKRQAVKDIEALYASAQRRSAPEPVITAGVLAADWVADYSSHTLEYLPVQMLRPHVDSALRRLARAGKLSTSIALKAGREVRAYGPAHVAMRKKPSREAAKSAKAAKKRQQDYTLAPGYYAVSVQRIGRMMSGISARGRQVPRG